MTELKRILVPVDLSERSARGLDYATMLARATGASLVLCCNVDGPERNVLEPFARNEHLTVDEAGVIELERLAGERAAGLDAKVVVSYEGSAADAILDVAEREGADAIVIASHGRTGMTRWLLGSVAEKVVRSADIPVIVVPTRAVGEASDEQS